MTFEIYSEGHWRSKQDNGKAHKIGEAEGDTFEEAVLNFFKERPNWGTHFNSTELSYWGCLLFPTLEEAKQYMG